MSDCLVTTLKESVTDESLLKLGEIKFGLKGKSTVIDFGYVGGVSTFTLVGDAYFTNSEGTANYGKTKTGEFHNYLKNNGKDCELICTNKYEMTNVAFGDDAYIIDLSEFTYMPIHYLDMNWSSKVTGSLEDIEPCADMEVLGLNWTKVDGDIKVLASWGSILNVTIHGTNVGGNLSSISGCTTAQLLDFSNTKITGGLSALAGLTNLVTLNLSNTSTSGDTSDLAPLTNLTTFSYANTAITGTWPLV